MGALDDLGRELAQLRQERTLAKRPQLAFSSLEDGAVEEYDADGNLVQIIGKQFDGGHGAVPVSGPTPPTPTAASLTAGPSSLTARWNGTFTDADSAPTYFSRVEVHLSTIAGFEPDTADTLVGTIESPRGGEVVISPLASGTYYVRLVARSTAGKASAPSARTSGSPNDAGEVDDGTPPPVPTAPTVEAVRAVFVVGWDGNGAGGETMPAKFRHAIVEMADAQGGPFTPKTTLTGKGHVTVAVNGYGQRWFRLRTVDRWGNTSAPSGTGTATTTPLVQLPDIADVVAGIDQKATNAATTAGAAAGASADAQAAAAQAMTDAGIALTAANGKTRVVFLNTTPPVPAGGWNEGDVWYQRQTASQTSPVVAWHRWQSGSWVAQAMAEAFLPLVNIGTGTYGELKGGRLEANTIVASKLVASEELWAKVLGVHKILAGEADLNSFVADVGFVSNLRANILTIGAVPQQALQTGIEEVIPNPKWMHPVYDVKFGPDKAWSDDAFTVLDTAGWAWDTNAVNLRFGQTKQIITRGNTAAKTWSKLPVTDYLPTNGGDKWYISADFMYGAGTDFYLQLLPIWYDAAGARIFLGGGSVRSDQLGAGMTNNIWGAGEKVLVAPDGAVKVRFVLEKSNTNTTGWVMCGRMSARRVLQGADATGAYTEVSPQGFRLFGEDGAEVISLTSIPPNYLDIKDSDGASIASLSAEGGISGTDLNVESDPVFMGSPLLGELTDFSHPSEKETSGLLEFMPRGMLSRGYRNCGGMSVTNGEMELMEISFDSQLMRSYRICVSPISAYVSGSRPYGSFYIRYTNDGTRPNLNSPILHRQTVRNETGGSIMFHFGGTFYYLGGSEGTIRLLFTLQGDGGTLTVFNTALGGALRGWVDDLGLSVPDTGVDRNSNNGSTPVTAPPPPEKKNYTKTYKATAYRSYYTSGGHYAYNGSKMYQGASPVAGGLQSIAILPNMTGDLAGATITSVKAYFYFEHWYYNAGGTAQIGLHGATSLPGSKPSITHATSSSKWPKPGGRWVSIPSSYWNGIKSGTYRGLALGDTSPSTTEYGIATGSKTKLEIKYTK